MDESGRRVRQRSYDAPGHTQGLRGARRRGFAGARGPALRSVAPLALALLLGSPCSVAAERACAVLLHGLARTAWSMKPVAATLTADYVVINVGYPSRSAPIAALAERAVGEGFARCAAAGAAPVHFVTHSLGGILVRQYAALHGSGGFGRVVMLAPPNGGSELVDVLREVPGFRSWNGPAGLELGTDAASVPRRLGPAPFELGVIAGETRVAALGAWLPVPHDGKVSAASTRLEGMTDFLLVPVSHTFIMRDEAVLAAVRRFLRDGRFSDRETGCEGLEPRPAAPRPCGGHD